jgi:hypothetical protein
MIKLKNLILESWLDDNKIEHLAKNCQLACKCFIEGKYLYRGYKSDGNYIEKDPSLNYRRTLGDEIPNYFQVVSDSIWPKQIQRRSRSIIFTTSRHDAIGYGSLYYVFPYDGAKISFGDESDNYSNYRESITAIRKKYNVHHIPQTLDSLSRVINAIFTSSYTDKYNWKGVDINVVRNDFLQFDTIDPNLIKNTNHRSIFEVIQKIGGLEKFIELVVDPVINKIQTTDILGIDFFSDWNSELWTESKCILISKNFIDSHIDAFNDSLKNKILA